MYIILILVWTIVGISCIWYGVCAFFLYLRTRKSFIQTTGKIIASNTSIPLISKTKVFYNGCYYHTTCTYKGMIYIRVSFIDQNGANVITSGGLVGGLAGEV
ncbi:hypothetical protein MBAV_005985 [Candidatus Magnetobacterium bavaricum]|uniref:Uncharacterized protein n=1 Tax=Candidatus Magnetobacterium bavaricum TaxID=29290 RepID=A0A0F3GIW0_9BACT|nr:hypothetical protein MBAV_005985 [Candidatus Magnetobacterium bavaricum]